MQKGPSRDEQRRVFLKSKTRIPDTPKKPNEETVNDHSTVKDIYKEVTHTLRSTELLITRDDNQGNEDTAGSEASVQEQEEGLTEFYHENEPDPPTGNDKRAKTGGPQLGTTPAHTLEDQQHSTQHEEDVISPSSCKTQGQEEEKEPRAETSSPLADVSTDMGTTTQQSVASETTVNQDETRNDNPSELNATSGQCQSRGEDATKDDVSDRRVQPNNNKGVQKRPSRVTTRSDSTKHRSLSQGNIKDAFKRDAGHSSKTRENQAISPQPSKSRRK